jgi:hypothetical protein
MESEPIVAFARSREENTMTTIEPTPPPEGPVETAGSPVAPTSKRPTRRALIGIVAGSVVVAAGLFGGGIATGASISGSSTSTTQGQFGGQGGTAPTGEFPGGGAGGGAGGGGTTTGGTGTTAG